MSTKDTKDLHIDKMRFAKNLHVLRENADESLEQLAKSLGKSGRSTVFKWENGESLPDQDTIAEIASHYGVSVDKLLYDKIPILSFKDMDIDAESFLKKFFSLTPVFISEDAKKNELFMRAFSIDKNYRELNTSELMDQMEESSEEGVTDLLWRCAEWYYESFKEGVIAAGLNFLGLIMLLELQFVFRNATNHSLRVEDDEIKIKAKEIISRKPIDNYKERISALNEIEGIVDNVVAKLWGNISCRDYLEYYLAKKYAFSIVNNNRGRAINAEYGYEMIGYLSRLGNPYAKKLIDFTLDLAEDVFAQDPIFI